MMRLVRAVLVAAGTLAAGWGGWLLLPELRANTVSLGVWLVGGPVLHDALVAPLAGVFGVLVAAAAPAPWRVPVISGLAVSGVLVLVGLPLLLHPSVGPPNPGLGDRHYWSGLIVALAVVWMSVAVVGVVRQRHRAQGVD